MNQEHSLADDEGPFFTLVFKGDLAAFKGNPFLTDTPFGRPVSAGLGNAFDELEALADYEPSRATLTPEDRR